MRQEVLTAIQLNHTQGFAIKIQLDRKDFVEIKNFFELYDIRFNKKLNIFEVSNKQLFEQFKAYFAGEQSQPKSLRQDFHFFETPQKLIQIAKEVLSLDTDYQFSNMRFLEPSAGRGAIVDAFRANFREENIYTVELTEENASILEKKGYKNIIRQDFLTVKKEQIGEFDFIVMNPPYNNNEYMKHVIKAYDLLSNSGSLVAIIPYTFIQKKNTIVNNFINILDNAACDTLPIYANMFDKTKIKVIVLHLTKSEINRKDIFQNPYATRGSRLGLELANDYDFASKINKQSDIEKNIQKFTKGIIQNDYVKLPYSQTEINDAVKYLKNYFFEDEVIVSSEDKQNFYQEAKETNQDKKILSASVAAQSCKKHSTPQSLFDFI